MNKKNNKGWSTIAIIIVLAVMIAAIVETVMIIKKWNKKVEIEDLTTVMLSIQARSKTYSDKETMKESENEKNKKEYKGKLIKEIDDNDQLNYLIENKIIEKDEKYYLLSKQELEDLHVYDVKDSDVFLVNYETEEVLYLNGIEKDGNVLYKLSDIKGDTNEKISNESENNNTTTKDEKSNESNENKKNEEK